MIATGTVNFRVEENYPLAPLTTFNLGGHAKYYASVGSEADLLQALNFAKARCVPIFILGGGSNILVSDGGYNGLVIHNRIKGGSSWTEGSYTYIQAGSGEDWQEFVDRCVSENLQGVECLSGIPGTVGASPVQNIGAYGQDVSETIVEVKTIEIDTGESRVLDNNACGFGYRTSIFNSTSEGKYIITRVTFRLKRNGKPAIAHAEVANHLKGNSNSTIPQVRDCVIAIRANKGLLVREGHERFQCAGSFFQKSSLNGRQSQRS